MAKLDKLEQADHGWMVFMLQEGKGFTRAGIARLNDSIRMYVWCILDLQAETRSPIVGSGGTSLNAQQQFLVILEDGISQSQSLSIPRMIKRFEKAIARTRSRLNYAIAPDLYMIPADMVLKVGIVQGYNNNITVATREMVFGINDEVNSMRQQPKMVPVLVGKPPTIKRAVDSPAPPVAKHHMMSAPPVAKHHMMPAPPTKPVQSHSDNKIYLVLSLGALVGLSVTYFKN
jgi:hypothetical protein